MKCPMCGKAMTRMEDPRARQSPNELAERAESLYYCERHGVMNKPGDLKEKADQIAKST